MSPIEQLLSASERALIANANAIAKHVRTRLAASGDRITTARGRYAQTPQAEKAPDRRAADLARLSEEARSAVELAEAAIAALSSLTVLCTPPEDVP